MLRGKRNTGGGQQVRSVYCALEEEQHDWRQGLMYAKFVVALSPHVGAVRKLREWCHTCAPSSSLHRVSKLRHTFGLYIRYLFYLTIIYFILLGTSLEVLVWEEGCGSLVVKVTNSWLACHEFKPGTVEDPSCTGDRCTLNMSRLKCPPVGVVLKLGEDVWDASSSVLLVT
ncbi:hypothetical protein TNCV_3105621 [Trichonephila clavipes]|nr:hypothetical protein TNCV_3105621 [Trichonephila clavipes]